MNSKRLSVVIEKFNKETDKLLRLKTTYYRQAYKIEQIFDDECQKNPEFALQHTKFRAFMELYVFHFDYLDYLKFKGFYTVNRDDIIERLDNSSLDYIRSRVVGVKGLLVSESKFVEFLDKLPKDGVISYEQVYSVFNTIRKNKTKKPGRAPRVRIKPQYTKTELNRLSKNDIINLCINLQSALKRKE